MPEVETVAAVVPKAGTEFADLDLRKGRRRPKKGRATERLGGRAALKTSMQKRVEVTCQIHGPSPGGWLGAEETDGTVSSPGK